MVLLYKIQCRKNIYTTQKSDSWLLGEVGGVTSGKKHEGLLRCLCVNAVHTGMFSL